MELLMERVTFGTDGFPIKVARSANGFVCRMTRSGKYKDFVVKGEMTIAFQDSQLNIVVHILE